MKVDQAILLDVVSTLLWMDSWRGGFGNQCVTTSLMVIRQNLACRQGRTHEQMVTKTTKGAMEYWVHRKGNNVVHCNLCLIPHYPKQPPLPRLIARVELDSKSLSLVHLCHEKNSRGCMRARRTPTLECCTELVLITCWSCELTQILIVHWNVLYRYLNEIDFDGHVLEWIAGWPRIGPTWGKWLWESLLRGSFVNFGYPNWYTNSKASLWE